MLGASTPEGQCSGPRVTACLPHTQGGQHSPLPSGPCPPGNPSFQEDSDSLKYHNLWGVSVGISVPTPHLPFPETKPPRAVLGEILNTSPSSVGLPWGLGHCGVRTAGPQEEEGTGGRPEALSAGGREGRQSAQPPPRARTPSLLRAAWAGRPGPGPTFLLRTLSFSTTPSRRLTTESTAGQLLRVFSSSATTMVTWLVSRSMFF